MALADGISFQAQSVGVGSFVFGTARASFLTLAQAVTAGELTDGQTVSYLAQDSLSVPTQREWGHGTFTAATNTIARTAVLGNNLGTTAKINFVAAPIVSLTVLAEDFAALGGARVLDAHTDPFGTFNLFGGTQGPYWTNNNAWNIGTLTSSQYAQTITVFPATFPSATVFNWSYPATAVGGNVYAYPEIVFGTQAGGGFIVPPHTPTAMTINSFQHLSLTYDMYRTFADEDADCLIETWVQTVPDNPATNVTELQFLPHAPTANYNQVLGWADHFNYSSGGFNAYVAANPSRSFIQVLPVTAAGGTTALDMTFGRQTIPVLGVLQAIVSQGWIAGTDYISGFEFGFEIAKNAGTATINSIDWTWDAAVGTLTDTLIDYRGAFSSSATSTTTLLTFEPTDATNAVFGVSPVQGDTNTGTARKNDILMFGYNPPGSNINVPVKANEATLTWRVEGHRVPNGTTPSYIETYFDFANNANNAFVRPWFAKLEKTTGYLDSHRFVIPDWTNGEGLIYFGHDYVTTDPSVSIGLFNNTLPIIGLTNNSFGWYLWNAGGATTKFRIRGLNGPEALSAIPVNTTTAAVGINLDGADPTTGTALDIGGVMRLESTTVGALPTPQLGMLAVVTDNTTSTWGATAGTSGALKTLVWYNGTNWTVAGK